MTVAVFITVAMIDATVFVFSLSLQE